MLRENVKDDRDKWNRIHLLLAVFCSLAIILLLSLSLDKTR